MASNILLTRSTSETFFNPPNIPPRPKTPFHAAPTIPIPILRSTTSNRTFTFSRELGKGHTSFVIAVWTPSGLQEHALKIPFPRYSKDVEKEARLLESLQDVPHTIQFQGDFTLAPACYAEVNQHLCLGCQKGDVPRHAILTDILPCQDARVTFLAPLSEGEASILTSNQIMSIGKQLAETLRALELKNLIHRDIKPSNMAYEVATDRLFVCDFGFTKKVDEIRQGNFKGTPNCAAPEYLLGKSIDTSADMWSCAATLFELYTGEALAQTTTNQQYPQTFNDLCHIITQNIGPFPPTFIASIPDASFWFKNNGSTALRIRPSVDASDFMDYVKKIGLEYPDIPVWEARIKSAAKKKGETEAQAIGLIDFLRPMFRYEKRIPPLEVTQRLTMQDTHSRYIKVLHPHQATRLSVPQILSIGEQALETLHHDLHAKGLIHQDLTPENIAYDETTNWTVIYGLRHAINQPVITQEYPKKISSYQSPEQLLELFFNRTVDVWGLGAILFELYTGTQLIPTIEPKNRRQAIVDFWHMIIQNVGPLPEGYLDAASASARSYFATGDSNEIAYPPSEQAKQLMDTFQDIGKEYPSIPLWQARIYAAAKQKGEPKTQAKSLITFLSRMLRYEEERTTAADALQRLAILHKAEQEEGKRHPLVRAAKLHPRNGTA